LKHKFFSFVDVQEIWFEIGKLLLTDLLPEAPDSSVSMQQGIGFGE